MHEAIGLHGCHHFIQRLELPISSMTYFVMADIKLLSVLPHFRLLKTFNDRTSALLRIVIQYKQRTVIIMTISIRWQHHDSYHGCHYTVPAYTLSKIVHPLHKISTCNCVLYRWYLRALTVSCRIKLAFWRYLQSYRRFSLMLAFSYDNFKNRLVPIHSSSR